MTADDQHVYPRDASWWRSPDTTTVKVLHWAGRNLDRPISACGRVMICDDMPFDPASIRESRRCQGSGCCQRWAAWLARQAA